MSKRAKGMLTALSRGMQVFLQHKWEGKKKSIIEDIVPLVVLRPLYLGPGVCVFLMVFFICKYLNNLINGLPSVPVLPCIT